MLWLALLLLLAFPAAASAGTASVQPYVEPPDIDPFGSCSRYMMCPPDMVVFEAAPGDANRVTITQESGGFRSSRVIVRDEGAPVQAGSGCEQVDPATVACTAATIGPLRLGDGDDRLTGGIGQAFGGEGADAITMPGGSMAGGGGDDVLTGQSGRGGGGDDLLLVGGGEGGRGEDVLRCPAESLCVLDGGPGDDRIKGTAGIDWLFGGAGDDVVRGGADSDRLLGQRGNDRLIGGADDDQLVGGRGADVLVSREAHGLGDYGLLDRVNCGMGRQDRAVADRRDDVKRCERVRLPPP